MAQELFRVVSEKCGMCYGFLNGIQEVVSSILISSTNKIKHFTLSSKKLKSLM
jgi:hypothetical protein